MAILMPCKHAWKPPVALNSLPPPSDPHHILHQATTLLHQYHARLRQRLHGGDSGSGGTGSGSADSGGSSGTGGRAEAIEPVDDGPQAERTCLDRHPQCQAWVAKVRWGCCVTG